MTVKELPEGLRQSLAEIEAQRQALWVEIKRIEQEKEVAISELREKRQRAAEFKEQLLADLFEDRAGHVIELSEDGKYAVRRFEQPPSQNWTYLDHFASSGSSEQRAMEQAEGARLSHSLFGPLGRADPPGVPR